MTSGPVVPDRDAAGAGVADGSTASTVNSTAVSESGWLELPDGWFVVAAMAILLVAAAFRLPELALNPFHHDEGVNGFFTTNLVRNGTYTYDPANYHGPSLYYLALVSEIVFGLTTEAMRFVPVVFGLLLVGLVFALRRYLGSVATLSAAAVLAVSPGMVYVSRYFIHEMLLAALTLAVVVTVTLYLDRRRPGYLLAAAVSAGFLFTTKETAVITVAVLLIAVVVGHYYTAWRNPSAVPRRAATRPPAKARSIWVDGVEYRPARVERAPSGPTGSLLPRWIPGEDVAGALVVFLVIYILLFTSFFTNFPQGLIDSLTAYVFWFQHGDATQVQPIYRYLQWMIPIGDPGLIPVDVPILVLGIVGGLIAAIRAPSRAWVIVGLWAAGITAAYSLIQYKTPWIIVNMLLPLALLAGLAVQELWQSRFRLAMPLVLGAALAVNGYQAIDLNFNRYDDQAYGYVYVHSTRDMLAMIDEIEATADRAGTGKQTGVVFMGPAYWPLPWYFRDYPRAGFYGQIVDTEEAMIVADVTQEAELAPKIAGKYDLVGQYNLRPGVDLALYVRSDIPKG
jgi:uncharacterized protein (TIGR03663 family)